MQGNIIKAFIVNSFIVSCIYCMDGKIIRGQLLPLMNQSMSSLSPLPIEVRYKMKSNFIGLLSINEEKIKQYQEFIAKLNCRPGILVDMIFFDQQQMSGFNMMIALID